MERVWKREREGGGGLEGEERQRWIEEVRNYR